MMRYSVINKKFPREIVLLKATPCKWGKCSFCDYIHDNSMDIVKINEVNLQILEKVTGEYGVLEIINSGNVFELPSETLEAIKKKVEELDIKKLFLEAHWIYRSRLQEMRNFFGVDIIFKTGLETFNERFREDILKKGFNYKNLEELRRYFDSVCLMVGIKGQTRDTIKNDIKLALENFDHFTVNVYTENTTHIEPDKELRDWFQAEYRWLEGEKKCEVLWVNTDFGVG